MTVPKISVAEFRMAIHQRHGCEAGAVAEVAEVALPRRDGGMWRGRVHVFEITGHPEATRCSAWPEAIDEATVMVRTVLHSGGIASAEQAVRAALRGTPRPTGTSSPTRRTA